MTDRPPISDSVDDSDTRPDHASTSPTPPSTPRWVKVVGILGAVLVLLVVAMMVLGGGRHGPSRHSSTGAPGSETPISSSGADLAPSGARVGSQTPPEGGR